MLEMVSNEILSLYFFSCSILFFMRNAPLLFLIDTYSTYKLIVIVERYNNRVN